MSHTGLVCIHISMNDNSTFKNHRNNAYTSRHRKATRYNKCNINNTSGQNALCLKSFATHICSSWSSPNSNDNLCNAWKCLSKISKVNCSYKHHDPLKYAQTHFWRSTEHWLFETRNWFYKYIRYTSTANTTLNVHM